MSNEAAYIYFVPNEWNTFKTKDEAIRAAVYDNKRGNPNRGVMAAPMGQPAETPRAFLMQAVAEIDISSPQLEATIPDLPKI